MFQGGDVSWRKQFEREHVLELAMQAFWARGYGGTSMQDLVQTTGVNRASLYATFGDKRELFLEALTQYDRIHRERWFAGLRSSHDPRGSIIAAFREAARVAMVPGGGHGCFLVNTAFELRSDEGRAQALVDSAFQQTERFFEQAVLDGQEDQSIRSDADARVLAAALLALFLGLRVLSRGTPRRATLERIELQVSSLL